MSFLHSCSCESVRTELDIFALKTTQTSVENSSYFEYKPVSALTQGGNIEFYVNGGGDEYLDLSSSFINITAQIYATVAIDEANQAHQAVWNRVGPVNNFLSSLFASLDVSINQKTISSNSNTYAYRAYLENLLNYDKEAKSSYLSSVLWADDTPEAFDDTANLNQGLVKRRTLIGGEKTVQLKGRIHADIFNQDKLLINGCDVKLKFTPSRIGFAIMDPTGVCDVRILEATLLVRRVKINPSILLAHSNLLSKATAKYPLTKVEIKTVSLQQGSHGEFLDNLILGQLPKRVILGFVLSGAFNGSRTLNPFNFQNFNINYLCLHSGGQQYPNKPLQPDFARNHFVDAYHTLFTDTCSNLTNQSNGISRDQYKDGNCLFCFDLSADSSASDNTHWNLIRNGNLRIEVRFSEPLAQPVNLILYAEFDAMLELTSNRECIID